MISIIRRKTPVILQLSETECGIASLAMVMAYHDMPVSLENLREDCGISRDGCKAGTLIQVANEYGFVADAYKIEPDILRQLSAPVIAWWNFNHYVVITRVINKKFVIHDPAVGVVQVGWEDFDKAFTGVIIDLSPPKGLKKSARESSLVPLFKFWVSGFYKELGFILLNSLLIILMPYLKALISGFFTDQCIVEKNLAWIPGIIFLVLLISFVQFGTGYAKKMMQFRLDAKASIIKSATVVSHIFQLPMIFFVLRQRSEMISILDRIESVINIIFKNSLDWAMHLLTSILCIVFMFKINLMLFSFSLIATGISVISFYFLSRVNYLYEMANVHVKAKLYSHSISMMRNLETIKACSLSDNILKKWKNLFARHFKRQDSINLIEIGVQVLTKSFNSILTAAMLCMGCYEVSVGCLSMGQLMQFFVIYLVFYNSISQMTKSVRDLQNAYVIHSRISDILLYKKDGRFDVPSQDNNTTEDSVALTCQNMHFFYNKHSPPVLKGISLIIMKSQHIALVGRTGSGKSTLAKLFCGLFEANMGDITLLGMHMSQYAANDFSRLIACVSQEVNLFSGSLYQNLVMFKENVSSRLVNDAIEIACLTELVSERGLYAEVMEEGGNFSGGEKQRIDIARAIIQDTPILVLDEATSALDIKTEKRLINNLRRTTKTIIFVAHRLSTIEHCDQIFVMENGRIVEQGNHQQLMHRNGYYQSLVVNDN